MKSNFSPLFLKEQAMKPCPNCRTHDRDSAKKNDSSVRPNLTDLVKKQVSEIVKMVLVAAKTVFAYRILSDWKRLLTARCVLFVWPCRVRNRGKP